MLIFGGSQGARAINNAMVAALPQLKDFQNRLQITHQTGEADYETIQKGYAENGWASADIRPYIKDMMSEFAKSDLIICRAGATTCAELEAAGKASLMIPLPTAADDHQRVNAEALVKANAARMILQQDLTGESLAREIIDLIEKPEKITAMEIAAKGLAKADAAEVTVNLIEDLAARR